MSERPHKAVHGGAIGLTFDDGPDEVWTPRVLAELRRLKARATFFVLGERARRAPGLLSRMVREGHEVALHGHRHVRHSDICERELENDTLQGLNALALAGVHPRRWRTPWGICTPATVAVAERHRLELVHWTVDTHDWRGDTAWQMLSSAARELHEQALVLMHDALGPGATRSGCESTVALIAPLCELARARGLRVESLQRGVVSPGGSRGAQAARMPHLRARPTRVAS
jgi:peptidoglycan/xylan/chitin deacetylase (PgdA/CDA1 family)